MQLNRFVTTAVAAALIACPRGGPAPSDARQPRRRLLRRHRRAHGLPSIPKVRRRREHLRHAEDVRPVHHPPEGGRPGGPRAGAAALSGDVVRPDRRGVQRPAAGHADQADGTANDTAANQLQQILKYHLINAQVDASKIQGAKGPVNTVENTPVLLDGSQSGRPAGQQRQHHPGRRAHRQRRHHQRGRQGVDPDRQPVCARPRRQPPSGAATAASAPGS